MKLSKGQFYACYDQHDDVLEVVEVLDVNGKSVSFRHWEWDKGAYWTYPISEFELVFKRYELTTKRKARRMWIKFRIKQWLLRQVNRIQIPE